MPTPMDNWTTERIDLLKKLWNSGLSASLCMEALRKHDGATFSRSAIMGKVNRLGLQRRERRPRTEKIREPRRREPKGQAYINRDFRAAIRPPKADEAPPACPLPPQAEPLGSLLSKNFKVREVYGNEHVAERCTYVDDCAEPPVKGRFFCAAHCAIVYLPAKPPRNPSPHYRNPPRRN